MRINKIIKDSKANGPGTRYTIWVQGCSIHCPGCCNKDTWNPTGGYEMSIPDLITDIKTTPIGAITLTGGEPLDQYDEVLELFQELSPRGGLGYNTFLTTGYSWDRVNKDFKTILSWLDFLVTEPFIEALKDNRLLWRGSTNQSVYFLTDRAKLHMNDSPILAEVRIGTNGNALITGFSIPDSMIPDNLIKAKK